MESDVVLLLPAQRDYYLPAMPLLRGDVYRYEDRSAKNYVGATRHAERRREEWVCTSSDYAGPKIAAARKITPPDQWEYYSFPVFDTDSDRLDQRLKEYETYYIAQFNSFENGYNGNRGGVGRPGMTLIQVTAPDGTVSIYFSYNEAGKALNLTSGGVQYYLDKKADSTNKAGYKFERLNKPIKN